MFDVIVVGSGFAGAVFAREMADSGRRVLLLEQRAHIGGNMHETELENGVRVHRYGPHIFHTNSKRVWQWLKPYAAWYPYTHKVRACVDGKLVPIPFNFRSVDLLFSSDEAIRIKSRLLNAFGADVRLCVFDLLNHATRDIQDLGAYIYDKVLVHYEAKRWGIPPQDVTPAAVSRAAIVTGYDERYFNDTYQYMPEAGYPALFDNILRHELITVSLNTPAAAHIRLDFDTYQIYADGAPFPGILFYTGAVDALLDYKYGTLPYRSLNLTFETFPLFVYQPYAVIHYPMEKAYTRVTEFPYITAQKLDWQTAVLWEYPCAYQPGAATEPMYPLRNPDSLALYERCRKEVKPFTQLHLCGRLAEYQYYAMDEMIEKTLILADTIKCGD